MNLTFEEIKERLVKLDEITLLEILDISSEDIVERFSDLIELKQDDLEEELSDEADE
jgi:hypothetical protein